MKDIEIDSIISQHPNNVEINNKQLIWTFSDFEPTTNDDIKLYYNSNKILYKGEKPIPPVFIVDGDLVEEFDLKKTDPNDIASIEVLKKPEKTRRYTNQTNGVVKIYTKDFVLTELKRIVEASTNRKIISSDYDKFKEDYDLFVNENKVDFHEVIDIKNKSIVKIKIMTAKGEKNKIMIALKKIKPSA